MNQSTANFTEGTSNRGASIVFNDLSPEDKKTLKDTCKFLPGRAFIKQEYDKTIIVEFWSSDADQISLALKYVKDTVF